MPLLHQLPLDKTLIESSIKDTTKQVLADKTPPSPMPPPSMSNTSDYLMNTGSGASTPGGAASDPLKTGSGKPGEASDADLGKIFFCQIVECNSILTWISRFFLTIHRKRKYWNCN